MMAKCRIVWAPGFHLLSHVARRFRLRAWALTILLALTPVLLSASPARAGCNFEDMVDAFKQAVSTTAECEPVCQNAYECYAVAVLAAALTFDVKQGVDISPLCTDMPAKVEDLMAKLAPLLSQQDMAEISQYANYISDALKFVSCACKTTDLNIANESSFGQCINDVAEAVGCKPIVIAGFVVAYDCVPGNPVSDAFDAIEGWTCKTLELGCGDSDYVEANYKPSCPSGLQSDRNGNCVPCESIANATTGTHGECACKAGYTEDAFWLYVPGYDTKYKILKSCAFSCSAPLVYSGGFCQCPFGTQSDYAGGCKTCTANEKYVPFKVVGGVLQEGRCEPCPLCTRPSANQLSCGNPCNNAAGEIFEQGKCVACPSNSKAVYFSGSCGQCQACDFGQKVSANHQSCIPACAPGQIMGGLMLGKDQAADPTAYQCQTCPDNTYASYESTGNSRGICLPCADGKFSKAGATQCLDLNCAPGSYQDPNDPHACKSCPPTQIYIPTEKKIVPGPAPGQSSAQVVPGHCGCGDNQVLQGGVCVCAQGATKIPLPGAPGTVFACACPAGAHFNAASGACACPAGATLNAAKNACICPTGEHLEGGKCVAPSLQVLPLKDCSALGPNYINSPKNRAACLRCPAGRIANAERNACVAGGRPPGPAIIPPPAGRAGPAVVPPPAVRARPALRCRPGMMPNAAGTACIRPPALQRVVPPPGARRPAARFEAPARPRLRTPTPRN